MSKSTDFIPQFQAVFSQMGGYLPHSEYIKVKQFILGELAKQDHYCRFQQLRKSKPMDVITHHDRNTWVGARVNSEITKMTPFEKKRFEELFKKEVKNGSTWRE